jgi:hypothetical protein
VKHLEEQLKQPKYLEVQWLAEADPEEVAHRQAAQPPERSSCPNCQ